MIPLPQLVEDTQLPQTIPEAVEAAAQYWTPAMCAAAKPVPLGTMTLQQHAEICRTVPPTTVLPALRVPPQLPKAAFTTGRAITRAVQDRTVYPHSVVGKLRMSVGGAQLVGSAWVIGRRAVITAGHCVYDHGTRRFAEHVQFLPQYHRGPTVGTWTAVRMTTLREYVNLPVPQRFIYDLAAIVLDRDLPEDLGAAGYTINGLLQPGLFQSVGYPAEPAAGFPFDGEVQWQSTGAYQPETDPAAGTTRERNFAMLNDMTGGCSGGPILTTGSEPVAVGLNSHVLLDNRGRRETPARMFSPYFGGAFRRLIDWLQENGGLPNALQPPAPERGTVELKRDLTAVQERLGEIIAKI